MLDPKEGYIDQRAYPTKIAPTIHRKITNTNFAVSDVIAAGRGRGSLVSSQVHM